MVFPKSYELEARIKSLSERMKYFCEPENAYQNYVDKAIRSENLQTNLSFALAQIIEHLEFAQRTRDRLDAVIVAYNQQHGTSISVSDFEAKSWIRTVGGEVLIPQVVQSRVWKIGYDLEQKKDPEIPGDQRDLLLCLKEYYDLFKEEHHPWIAQEKLEEIVREKEN